jgi:hypothetical protein
VVEWSIAGQTRRQLSDADLQADPQLLDDRFSCGSTELFELGLLGPVLDGRLGDAGDPLSRRHAFYHGDTSRFGSLLGGIAPARGHAFFARMRRHVSQDFSSPKPGTLSPNACRPHSVNG